MPRKAPSGSPDPLALVPASPEAIIEAAYVSNAKAGPSRTTTPRSKINAVVEISSPKKRRASLKHADGDEVLLPTLKRTPLARGSPASNRGTPTPRTKANGSSIKKALISPTKPVKTPVKALPRSIAKSAVTPTLGSSVKQPLPTLSPITSTSRKRQRIESPIKQHPIPDERNPLLFDDTFDIPSPTSVSAVSREMFLANEASKRQREARNFKYTGDVNAPKLTRSGRVIGETEKDDVDEYGDEGEEQSEELVVEELRPVTQQILPEEDVKDDNSVFPLVSAARTLVLDMLGTLTGANIASDPPAFPNEEKNEALSGLVNLLRGTVERGEGNSALLVGARGVGKTRTIARALSLLPSTSKTSPIIVRLSGHAQTNDRLAIREMGRQIAEAEGKKLDLEEDAEGDQDDAEYAPTTLPSHLLALLTAPSPRAIVIIIEEFDLFTEHARQALLYCLLDVVQSVRTGPVETTGRGIAVIGVTSRVDTLLLLEKRVKSRFSHRMWRVISPLSPEQSGWREVMRRVLMPWEYKEDLSDGSGDGKRKKEDRELLKWKGDWQFAVDTLLEHDKVSRALDRLVGLTTDVRILYRPFISPITDILSGRTDFLSVPTITRTILNQTEDASWGLTTAKLKGLPQPALGILIISKHLAFAGRDEFTFAMVEEEYLRFSRTKLVGSGRTRWPISVLRSEFDHLLRLSLLAPAGNNNVKPRFAKVRCTLAPHEVVAWMKGDGGIGLGPELVGWGKMMGGHV